MPEVKARSWTVFGKGQREELDDGEAEALVRRMRVCLAREVERVRVEEGEGAWRVLLGGGGCEMGWGSRSWLGGGLLLGVCEDRKWRMDRGRLSKCQDDGIRIDIWVSLPLLGHSIQGLCDGEIPSPMPVVAAEGISIFL